MTTVINCRCPWITEWRHLTKFQVRSIKSRCSTEESNKCSSKKADKLKEDWNIRLSVHSLRLYRRPLSQKKLSSLGDSNFNQFWNRSSFKIALDKWIWQELFFTFEVSLEDFKIYCCGVVNSKIGHSTIFNSKIGHNTIFRFLLQTSSTLFVALRNHELNNWMTLRLQESRDYL